MNIIQRYIQTTEHILYVITNVFASYIVDLLVDKGSKVLMLGNNKNSLLGSRDLQSNIIAIFLDCSPR